MKKKSMYKKENIGKLAALCKCTIMINTIDAKPVERQFKEVMRTVCVVASH